LSIATMELIDNLIIVFVPGAMDAGLGSILFWGILSFALAIAAAVTVPPSSSALSYWAWRPSPRKTAAAATIPAVAAPATSRRRSRRRGGRRRSGSGRSHAGSRRWRCGSRGR
ncbi:MAG: DUF4396 domain-containing protein, partial [Actinobacteria bacterium]|nr:DUF4396 domain-containing protein [Actinomycetota bacterium]